MVTKRGLKIIVTSLKGKSRIKVQVDGQKLDRIGWKRTVWKWTVFDLIHMNMNEIIISILSFTINLQWFINNQWFVVTWSRYRLNDYRNRTGISGSISKVFPVFQRMAFVLLLLHGIYAHLRPQKPVRF